MPERDPEPVTSGGSAAPSLRNEIYRSGRFLVARQLGGMVVKLLGILAVTRIIGPEAYGLFAFAAAIAAVLSTVAIFGTDVQLVRVTPAPKDEHTAFWFLLATSIVVACCAVIAAPALGRWLGADGVTPVMRAIAVLLPVMVLHVPARAELERNLLFGPLAAAELAADLAVYVVAVPLAFAGAGVWAPVAGFAARHVTILIALYAKAGYRPRADVDRVALSELLRFGRGYSAGKWLSLVGQLVNPIIIGRLLGPTGVGQVAVAVRIIEQLGAVKQATIRLATAGFAKLNGRQDRLRAAHGEGVLVQVLGAVPLYAAAAFTAPWIVPVVFGSEWEPAVELLALLAIAASIGTLFNLAAPILRVLGHNSAVAKLRAAQIGAFVVVTLMTVPPLGIAGYGLARLARTVPFVLVHRELAKQFTPSYRSGLRWLLALVPMMTAVWWPAVVRPVLLLPPLALLATRTARSELEHVVRRAIGSFD